MSASYFLGQGATRNGLMCAQSDPRRQCFQRRCFFPNPLHFSSGPINRHLMGHIGRLRNGLHVFFRKDKEVFGLVLLIFLCS